MKKATGLLFAFLALSSVGGLTSCASAEERVEDVRASLVFAGLTEGIKVGFEVYNKIDGVKISYESANPDLLYFNKSNTQCIVNSIPLGSERQITSFTATFKYMGKQATKKFNVKVVPTGKQSTVKELTDYYDEHGKFPTYEYQKVGKDEAGNPTSETKVGQQYALQAVVTAKSSKEAVVYDGTGYMQVYASVAADIGKYVYVDGNVGVHDEVIQFGKGTSVSEIYDPIPFEVPEFAPQEFKSMTKLNAAYFDSPKMAVKTGTQMKLKGQLVKDDKYINFVVKGIPEEQLIVAVLNPIGQFSVDMDAIGENKDCVLECVTIAHKLSGEKRTLKVIGVNIYIPE